MEAAEEAAETEEDPHGDHELDGNPNGAIDKHGNPDIAG
jgi:hypothetical protein